jgi:glycosyltransferase involved in cell wall biosynthesis
MQISIITVTYNVRDSVRDCLSSVAAQTYPYREHVIIDGASTDGTLDVLQAHRQQLAALVSEPDRGIYDALNKGIHRAKGGVVGFLHADDVYAHPDVLRWVAEAFADPSVDAVYGDLEYVRQDDVSHVVRYWQAGPFSPHRLAWGWMPPHPTLYVRRACYARLGGFDTRYRIAADYHSILCLFSQAGFKAVYVPRVLVKMRVGGASNRSLGNIIRKSREDLDALRRTRVGALGGLGALAWKNLSKLTQFARAKKRT